MNPSADGWLLASLIFDSIWSLKNKFYTDEIAMRVNF